MEPPCITFCWVLPLVLFIVKRTRLGETDREGKLKKLVALLSSSPKVSFSPDHWSFLKNALLLTQTSSSSFHYCLLEGQIVGLDHSPWAFPQNLILTEPKIVTFSLNWKRYGEFYISQLLGSTPVRPKMPTLREWPASPATWASTLNLGETEAHRSKKYFWGQAPSYLRVWSG